MKVSRTTGVVIGSIVLVFVIALATGAFGAPMSFSSASQEAVSFTNDVLPLVLHAEDDSVLLAHATPEYSSVLSRFRREAGSDLVEGIRAVAGKLQNHSTPRVTKVFSGFRLPYGFVSNVSLAIDANFEKGPAVIEMDLTKRRGKWFAQALFVSSGDTAN